MVLEPNSKEFRDTANAAIAIVGVPAKQELTHACAQDYVRKRFVEDTPVRKQWRISETMIPWLPDGASVWFNNNGHADIARYTVGYRGEISGTGKIGLTVSTHLSCFFAVKNGKAAFVEAAGPRTELSNEQLLASLKEALKRM